MKNEKLAIVLANSAAAKIYRYDATDKKLELLSQISSPKAALKTREIMADEAGRYQNSSSYNQGTYGYRTDPKKVEAEKFAAELALSLEKINQQINSFVIIAPGHFQNFLKNKLEKAVLDKTSDFIDKDYTKLKIKSLEKRLSELLELKFGSPEFPVG